MNEENTTVTVELMVSHQTFKQHLEVLQRFTGKELSLAKDELIREITDKIDENRNVDLKLLLCVTVLNAATHEIQPNHDGYSCRFNFTFQENQLWNEIDEIVGDSDNS